MRRRSETKEAQLRSETVLLEELAQHHGQRRSKGLTLEVRYVRVPPNHAVDAEARVLERKETHVDLLKAPRDAGLNRAVAAKAVEGARSLDVDGPESLISQRGSRDLSKAGVARREAVLRAAYQDNSPEARENLAVALRAEGHAERERSR